MTRMLKALAIVLLFSVFVGMMAWIIVDIIGWEIPERLVTILSYLFGWPLLLLKPFIPSSDSPAPYAPLVRNSLFIVAVILDLALYSGLTHGLLFWHKKRALRNLNSPRRVASI